MGPPLQGQQHWLRAGAAATRGFRPPRGSASCSNTRARYIRAPHKRDPLGRNPLAATSFAAWRSLLRRALPSASRSRHRRSHGPSVGERRGGAGIGRKQAMDGLCSPVGARDGATRRCARSPHCRGSPRRRQVPALWLKPEARITATPHEAGELRRFSAWPDPESIAGEEPYSRPSWWARHSWVHTASMRCSTFGSRVIGRPHSRADSAGHLRVASRPSLEPRPDTGVAKSR